MLEAIHGFIFKRPKISALLALAIMGICALAASSAKFNESIADILPVHDQLIEEHKSALKHFGQDRTLYFAVYSDKPEKLAALTDAFAGSMSSLEDLKGEFHGGGNGNLDEILDAALALAPHIMDENDLAILKERLSDKAISRRFSHLKNEIIKFGPQPYGTLLQKDPLGILDILGKKLLKDFASSGFANDANAIISQDGKSSLIIAEFNFDSKDSRKSSDLVKKIHQLADSFETENPGAKIAFAGAYRISADNAKMARSDSNFCLAVSLAMMLALCLAAFKRRIYALLAMLPSILGTMFAFAVIGIVFKDVSAISIGFASIAIGVTIDYAIHFLFHANALSAKSREEFSKASRELVRPTVIGAATTIIAFAVMFFAGSRGFSQLGAFGAMGVAASAFLSLALLPPIAAKLRHVPPRPSIFDLAAEKIHNFESAKNFIPVALILTILSALIIPNLEFDGRISSFSGLYEQTKADDAAIRAAWPGAVSKSLALVRGDGFDDALEKNLQLYEKLSADADVENLDSLAGVLPPQKTRGKNLQNWEHLFNEKSRIESSVLNAAKSNGFKPEFFSESLNGLSPLPFEEALKKFERTPLDALLQSRIKYDGETVYISSFFNIKPGADRMELRKRMGGEGHDVILADNALFETHVSSLARLWMLKFLALALALVSAYVLWAFKSFAKAALVIVPVCVGLCWTFGAMAFFGIPVTLVNAIFVIFAVCIAEDYSVFIIFERLRGRNSGALQSVIVSALTTIVGFGALGLAKHPILNGLGMTAAISIFCILFASLLITLPLSKKIKVSDE